MLGNILIGKTGKKDMVKIDVGNTLLKNLNKTLILQI